MHPRGCCARLVHHGSHGGPRRQRARRSGRVRTGAPPRLCTVCTSWALACAWLQGIEARRTFQTNMNVHSSRSHAVFLLTIARAVRSIGVTKYSQLYLVDLAGSEKVPLLPPPPPAHTSPPATPFGAQVWKTLVVDQRLEEAKFINKARVLVCWRVCPSDGGLLYAPQSLLALGKVIGALATGAPHVPYRDSKLTRLLKVSRPGLLLRLHPWGYTLRWPDTERAGWQLSHKPDRVPVAQHVQLPGVTVHTPLRRQHSAHHQRGCEQ